MKNKAVRLTAKQYLSMLIEKYPFYSGTSSNIDELVQVELERVTKFSIPEHPLDTYNESEMIKRSIETTSGVSLPRTKQESLF